jgi:uncharacterized membrane protein
MIKTALKIFVLFLALTLCSAGVVSFFTLIGLEFDNAPRTVFVAALLATVVLVLTTKKDKKKHIQTAN